MEENIIYPVEVKEGESSLRPLVQAPEIVLQEAQKAATALQRVVANKRKPVIFKGEQYLEFEDWQTVAKFYGLCTRSVEAVPVEIFGIKGAKARAEVIDLRTGMIVGGAEAYCMRDEENWKEKPWFQLASMAQTRAGAKALRNVLAWVVVLAGYRPTPAEELTSSPSEPLQGSSSAQGTPEGKSSFPLTPSSSPTQSTSPAPSNGERPTREEIQNLLRLAYRNGFQTVNAEGKKCVDYFHLGQFLKEQGFPSMIKEMNREQCLKASLFLEIRAKSLLDKM